MAADGGIERTWKSAQPSSSLTCLQRCSIQCPDAVDPGDLGQARGRVRGPGLGRAAGPGQVGGQVPGRLARQGDRVGGGHHQAGEAIRAPPAQRRIGGPPGLSVPVAEGQGTGCQSPGSSGPVQASARAASARVQASAPYAPRLRHSRTHLETSQALFPVARGPAGAAAHTRDLAQLPHSLRGRSASGRAGRARCSNSSAVVGRSILGSRYTDSDDRPSGARLVVSTRRLSPRPGCPQPTRRT